MSRTPDGKSIAKSDAFMVQCFEIIQTTVNIMRKEEMNRRR